jgi:hypothetical protein
MGEETVPLTVRISKKAHDILTREVDRLQLRPGQLVTEAILWAEDCEVWDNEIDESIKEGKQLLIEARRARDRERKRFKISLDRHE